MTPLQTEIDGLGSWFHNLHLPDGTQTHPNHQLGDFPRRKWHKIAPHIPADLHGWRVLDIGCNAGFYTFELAKRGAQVVGIDVDPHYLRQAEWAAGQYGFGSQVEFREMQVYDLARTAEMFDLVWFMGVFYHLRYPMLGLDIAAQKVKKLMVFQTLTMPGAEVLDRSYHLDIDRRDVLCEPGWPKMAFIEGDLAGDPTNWWAANHAGVRAMLRSSGMRILAEPGDEIYLCVPDPKNPSCVSGWNRAELLSATGRPNRESEAGAHRHD